MQNTLGVTDASPRAYEAAHIHTTTKDYDRKTRAGMWPGTSPQQHPPGPAPHHCPSAPPPHPPRAEHFWVQAARPHRLHWFLSPLTRIGCSAGEATNNSNSQLRFQDCQVCVVGVRTPAGFAFGDVAVEVRLMSFE